MVIEALVPRPSVVATGDELADGEAELEGLAEELLDELGLGLGEATTEPLPVLLPSTKIGSSFTSFEKMIFAVS